MHSDTEQQYQEWLGKTLTVSDTLTTTPMEALAATLDRADTTFSHGDSLPPLWHWLYFLEPTRQSELAEDGHPNRGDFLPPIELPRRMWAGSRLTFLRPLRAGQSIERTSTIKSVAIKEGRSGKLGFVCVAHELADSEGVLLQEEHDIVYREMPSENSKEKPALKAEQKPDYVRTITPDPALLFRYSALTFNAHKIHYDRDHATKVESYAGLVVHGPLLAIFLLELFAENNPDATLSKFSFKAIRPVFDTESFHACGKKPNESGVTELWIEDNAGNLCMQAQAELAK
ncbi:MAG: acyl-CoA dehydrogenase [Pseudohongiella sp.]|nr:MAG: acyl-CoA dehydrogenase [Pseudohongiella sp.]